MVRMPYLRTTVVELSSETCLIIVSDDVSDNETSFRTEIDHSGAWIRHSHHLPLPLGGAQGAKMMNIAHLIVMMADSTSETWCDLANDASGERAVLYRSRIHVNLA